MKRNKPPDSVRKKKRVQQCIIHSPSTLVSDKFTFISDLPDGAKKLEELKNLKNLRLQQPVDSHYRMEDICSQIPDTLLPESGYHVNCYKKFTCKWIFF